MIQNLAARSLIHEKIRYGEVRILRGFACIFASRKEFPCMRNICTGIREQFVDLGFVGKSDQSPKLDRH
jgi:hypothetical protein